MELRGAVAVVTGASAGIGRATAWALAGAGARVAMAARRAERLEELRGEIEARGGEALAVRCDVTEVADLEGLRDAVMERWGRVDALVNNAGVPGSGPLADASLEEAERVIAVNYLGVVRATRVFLPILLDQGSGHVVNVASVAGRFGLPGASVYSSTKHAVVGFSESLHFEVEPRGVRVTALNPGFVRTEGFPQRGLPGIVVMRPERVARAVLRVLRSGKAPEATVPGWYKPLEMFRLATPPLYRWGLRMADRVRRRLPDEG
ncbi:MAG: SDR family oxidoreductase [Actinobacteria bacterium]|nr:SDR family oxidoreductase [Actinomycetota bacterium]